MANSVVKVTDSMLNDSLLLLVGEDGTVTPDKDSVQTYLKSQTGATNIQIMHVNKSDGKSIDVSIDNVTYMPDIDKESSLIDDVAMDLLKIIKLDHDYTPLCGNPNEEFDELAKTLSILDGENETETVTQKNKSVLTKVNETKIQKTKQKLLNKPEESTTNQKLGLRRIDKKNDKEIEENDEGEDYNDTLDDDDDEEEEEDDEDEDEDDGDDSDYEVEESVKKNSNKKFVNKNKLPTKLINKPNKNKKSLKLLDSTETKNKKSVLEVVQSPPIPITISSTTLIENKLVEKKPPPKKEKKIPKPIPDDFALFSTPDIIRRVGGKEPTTPDGSDIKSPAKITHENRSKSSNETSSPSSSSSSSTIKQNRLSVDSKLFSSDKTLISNQKLDLKNKDKVKLKRTTSVDDRRKSLDNKTIMSSSNLELTQDDGLEENMPSADEISAMMMNDDTNKLNLPDLNTNDQQNMDHNVLDTGGLALDPALLDNINNDLISEDILFQVAQSLVSNPELQNAIDKSINEGNLVLDPSIQQVIAQEQNLNNHTGNNISTDVQKNVDSNSPTKPTHIVRPDGRVVVIPPIERPTTRSRNKKKEDEKPITPKFTHKPLDEEHVSGNELDSDNEEESEDDPNKLWCICNQPHNNRFMICCDTCEEWYHGKCVNITKTMGQQMESEGKEWICLFCKDPALKRPQAAARRIRKASRNSRQSSDSVASSTKTSETNSGSVPCVVCQKASRNNSIFCSEACILAHAQGVERVVVFERKTGNMLTGNKAPSAANLEQWLREHPGYEVVRSAGKVVTAKTQNLTQSKLKLVKNSDNNGVSLAVQKKGVNVGVMRHLPKNQQQTKTPLKTFKMVSKQVSTTNQPRLKVIQPQPKTTTTSPIKIKSHQSSLKTSIPTTPSPKEKPVPVKTPKSRQAEQSSTTPIQPKQENIRENVKKTIFEQLINRLKLVDDFKLTEDEVKNISAEIESQLYKCFGDTGQKYRNKYRSLIFNIKDVKNQTLWRRICRKSVSPYQLVRLSPDDLASQELALWREREAKHQLDMIKKSELELLNCSRQYVLKTHKGEQVLEDNRPTEHIDNTEVITSLTESTEKSSSDSSLTKKDTKDEKKINSSSKHSHRDKERKSSKDRNDQRHHRSSSRDRKKRLRSRSREHSSKHGGSDKKRSRSRDREKHRRSSHKSSRHKKDNLSTTTEKLDRKSKEILEQLVDNKIVPPLEDQLWKHAPQEDVVPAPTAESDSDHEPTSTVTIPTPPRNSDSDEYQISQLSAETKDEKIEVNKLEEEEEEEEEEKEKEEKSTSPPPPLAQLTQQQKQQQQEQRIKGNEIWRGIINMVDVAQISITAVEVSGDCNGLGHELPTHLDIVGRISEDTVCDYIGKMKCSNSKNISLVRLNAVNVEEKMPYLALYSYLSSRKRLGVVKSPNKAVKDFYILPLGPQTPIPQVLLPINGPGFEESRPAMLLGIIVRDKRKRPLLDTSSSNPATITNKKSKIESPNISNTPATVPSSQIIPPRSYTPPPVKDPRIKLPLPPSLTPPIKDDDDDEPYSPEDSDPDNVVPAPITPATSNPTSFLDSGLLSPQPFQPFTNKFDDIPGLDNSTSLPSNTLEIQRQMEELNKKIEKQKSEINSISQNIATASTEIGTAALANIALPSNLQQILDSIKTIGAASTSESPDVEVNETSVVEEKSSTDLTIPLMIPKSFSRPLNSETSSTSTSNTIPLNLPSKIKLKPTIASPPLPPSIVNETDNKPNSSVLSSLSEEELIRRAAEMLGESEENTSSKTKDVIEVNSATTSFTSFSLKRRKLDLSQPPVPGLEDEDEEGNAYH